MLTAAAAAATLTQVGVAADGHPNLYGEPLKRLTEDFCVLPSLMG